MIIIITVIHVIVSIGLILIVLLQTGKGAEMGAVFGGSSSTIFGSSGAGNFLTRLTTAMAIVFMMTSLMLGYFSGRKPSSTIFDSRTPAVESQVPAQRNEQTTQPVSPPASTPTPAPGTVPQNPGSQKSTTP